MQSNYKSKEARQESKRIMVHTMDKKDRMITAKDYCIREQVGSLKARIKKINGEMVNRNQSDIKFIDCEPVGAPVFAEVNNGQWVA